MPVVLAEIAGKLACDVGACLAKGWQEDPLSAANWAFGQIRDRVLVE